MALAFPTQQPTWRAHELTNHGFSHKEAIISIVSRQLGPAAAAIRPKKLRSLIQRSFCDVWRECRRQRRSKDEIDGLSVNPASQCVKIVRRTLAALPAETPRAVSLSSCS